MAEIGGRKRHAECKQFERKRLWDDDGKELWEWKGISIFLFYSSCESVCSGRSVHLREPAGLVTFSRVRARKVVHGPFLHTFLSSWRTNQKTLEDFHLLRISFAFELDVMDSRVQVEGKSKRKKQKKRARWDAHETDQHQSWICNKETTL